MPQPVLPTLIPQPECQVITGRLNIRVGPGTNYPALGAGLSQGTRLMPLGRSPGGRWIAVRVIEAGQEGWTSADARYVSCSLPVDQTIYDLAAEAPSTGWRGWYRLPDGSWIKRASLT